MSALLEGFRTGYDRMNQHFQQEENKRRYDQNHAMRQDAFGLQKQKHEAQMTNYELERGLLNNRVNRIDADNQYIDNQRALALQTQGVQLGNAGQQTQINQNAIDQIPVQNQRAKERHESQSALTDASLKATKLNTKNANEQQKLARADRKLRIAYSTGNFSSLMSDPDFQGSDMELIFDGTGRKAAMQLAEAIGMQRWDAALPAFNQLYKQKLNRNVGQKSPKTGGDIKDISATGFEVQRDGSLKIPIMVTTDKGSYPSYISELRTGDKNDPDKTFSTDQLIGKGAALGNFALLMEQGGVNQNIKSNAGAYLGQGQSQKRNWQAYKTKDEFGNEVMHGWQDLNSGLFQKPASQAIEAAEVASMTPEEAEQRREDVLNTSVAQGAKKVLSIDPELGKANAEVVARMWASGNPPQGMSEEDYLKSLVAKYKTQQEGHKLKQRDERNQRKAGYDNYAGSNWGSNWHSFN